jgi:hypothetical protein
MGRHKLSIYDTKVNEYIYDKLSKLTVDQKRYLSSSELAIINSNNNLRKFVTWGTLEKKVSILTKVGINFYLIFYEKSEDFNALVDKVYKQYTMKRFKLDNIEAMRDKGVFIVSDKEAALSLSMLAQNCHSDVYFLNRDFMRISRMLDSLKTKIQGPLNLEFVKSEAAYHTLARMIFETKRAENFMRIDGLETIETMILLFLFQKPKTYVNLEAIQLSLQGIYTPYTVANRSSQLAFNGYIDKLPTESKRPLYTISTLGILYISKVVHKIVNDTLNT